MRSKIISALLGLVLLACSAVIVMDRQGAFGNEPFPGTGSSGRMPAGNDSPFSLPQNLPESGAGTSTPGQQTEGESAVPDNPELLPTSPNTSGSSSGDTSGYGDLK